MKSIFYYFPLIVLFFTGCGKPKPATDIYRFPDATWKRFKFLEFTLPVKDISNAYDISVMITYSADFPAEALYVNLVMTLPSGEERIRDYNLILKDRDGNWLGTKTEGVYKIILPIRNDIRFNEKGLLKIEVENLMTKYHTPGVIDFGFMLSMADE